MKPGRYGLPLAVTHSEPHKWANPLVASLMQPLSGKPEKSLQPPAYIFSHISAEVNRHEWWAFQPPGEHFLSLSFSPGFRKNKYTPSLMWLGVQLSVRNEERLFGGQKTNKCPCFLWSGFYVIPQFTLHRWAGFVSRCQNKEISLLPQCFFHLLMPFLVFSLDAAQASPSPPQSLILFLPTPSSLLVLSPGLSIHLTGRGDI